MQRHNGPLIAAAMGLAQRGVAGTEVPWTEVMRITKEGYVAIGTSYPVTMLEVQSEPGALYAHCTSSDQVDAIAVPQQGRLLPR